MSKGFALVSVSSRWLNTIWNISPALMYSLHLSTAFSKDSLVKLDLYGWETFPSGCMSVIFNVHWLF